MRKQSAIVSYSDHFYHFIYVLGAVKHTAKASLKGTATGQISKLQNIARDRVHHRHLGHVPSENALTQED